MFNPISAAAGLLSPKSWKIIGILLLIGALVGSALALVSMVKSWNIETYNNGFRAGALNVQQQWDQSNAFALKEQRDKVVQDAINSNNAVKNYLDEIMARKPEVIRVAERTTKYVQSPAGATMCLTPDGVQLLQGHRNVLGFTPSTPPGNSGAVPTTLPIPGPVENKP